MGWRVPAEVVAAVVAVLLLGMAVLLVGMFTRRRMLSRGSSVFDCAANLRPGTRRGFSVGMARYAGERLEWFRVFSVSMEPALVLPRRGTRIASQRPMAPGAEELPGLDRVLSIQLPALAGVRTVELALDQQSATGFMSWLEAAPPGV